MADKTKDHDCDTGYFDRTVCPEPCGMMHSYCATCGNPADPCPHRHEAQHGEVQVLARGVATAASTVCYGMV